MTLVISRDVRSHDDNRRWTAAIQSSTRRQDGIAGLQCPVQINNCTWWQFSSTWTSSLGARHWQNIRDGQRRQWRHGPTHYCKLQLTARLYSEIPSSDVQRSVRQRHQTRWIPLLSVTAEVHVQSSRAHHRRDSQHAASHCLLSGLFHSFNIVLAYRLCVQLCRLVAYVRWWTVIC